MSRIHRIGTIYSRVEGLIRKGHLNENDRPIWFDVYRRFPPKYEPTAIRKVPEVTVKEIFYEEDRLRAKIHKEFQIKGFNLESKHQSYSQKLIKTCQEYISKGMSEDDAVKELRNKSTSDSAVIADGDTHAGPLPQVVGLSAATSQTMQSALSKD